MLRVRLPANEARITLGEIALAIAPELGLKVPLSILAIVGTVYVRIVLNVRCNSRPVPMLESFKRIARKENRRNF
jgi:hypothetical protein